MKKSVPHSSQEYLKWRVANNGLLWIEVVSHGENLRQYIMQNFGWMIPLGLMKFEIERHGTKVFCYTINVYLENHNIMRLWHSPSAPDPLALELKIHGAIEFEDMV